MSAAAYRQGPQPPGTASANSVPAGHSVRALAAAVVFTLLLSGCEAQLNLAGVEQQRAQSRMRFDMFQAMARGEDQLIAVSSTGAVLASTTAGLSWERTDLPDNPTLIDIAACPDGRFAALDTRRKLWLLEDARWTERPIDTPESVLSITCDPANRIWVTAGFSTLLNTSDNGETWNMQSMDEDLQFTSIQFIDADWAVATGEFGTVTITEDGGETWNPAEYIPNEFYPMAVVFTDRQKGFVAGLNGITWVTRDGASTWTRYDTPSPTPLYGITARDGQVVAVGEGGAVYSWDGDGWRTIPGVPTMLAYLRAVEILDENTVLVGGGFGAIMRLSTSQTVAAASEG